MLWSKFKNKIPRCKSKKETKTQKFIGWLIDIKIELYYIKSVRRFIHSPYDSNHHLNMVFSIFII
jgi:hypothetical protein